jgi:hypothetical protein
MPSFRIRLAKRLLDKPCSCLHAAYAPVTRSAAGVPSAHSPPPDSQVASQEISVTYHRSGGFAGTDDTWTISADGTVSHQGQTPGTPEQLTAAQMAELTAALRAANFMSLEDAYVPKDSCCDRYLANTVMIGGRSKTVRTIDASPTAPAGTDPLVLIHSIKGRHLPAAG